MGPYNFRKIKKGYKINLRPYTQVYPTIVLNEYDYMLLNISLLVRAATSVLHAYPLDCPSHGGTFVTIVGI